MKYHRSERFFEAGLPFSEAVTVGGVLYLSGQLGNAPGQKVLVAGGIVAEAHQTMQNIAHVLSKHGLSFDNVFRAQVMLSDMAEWGAFNAVYVSYFKPQRLPSRSAWGCSGLALGARCEVECWATVSEVLTEL
ncbi:MAG: RidA family protein [Rhizomicrobium sp.]|nr:RidA family protein [Rhizomicrobium sp.]